MTAEKDCVYTVTRLSDGLVYLYGRSDRLYVNKPNALLLTGRQSGSGGDKKVNKTDRVEAGKEESSEKGRERR